MSKKKKTKKSETKSSVSFLDKINKKDAYILCGILILATILLFYKPYVFDNLEPIGADRIASEGSTHQIREYQEKTGERALWNPSIFCGVPLYFNLNSTAFNFDILISWLNSFFDWRAGWAILGAIGLFLLFHYLKFPWYISLVGIMGFLFLPHFQSLFIVGHNSKIRAIFAMPLVIFGFLNYTRKRDLFSLLLFTLFFSLQFRTKHYQIIFYTLLLILTLGIWRIVDWVSKREYKLTTKAVVIFFAGLALSILMSAQPLFVAQEYTPYSTRGGNAINLYEEDSEEKSGGVTFEYATQWSLSPKEVMTLIIPRFYGGTSQEPYTGSKYPQLKGQNIPGYWGDMPFTQSSEYIGILTVILALIGIWIYRRNGFVISLVILLVFSFLLAFGRHFPILYKTLFFHLPYFDKFRAPNMILNLISFIFVIIALFGLKGIISNFTKRELKTSLFICGFFAAIGLIFLLFPGLLSYTSPKDAPFASNPQTMTLLKNIRMEFMKADTLRMLVFVFCFGALLVLLFKKTINKDVFVLSVLLLVSIDMIGISKRFLDNAPLTEERYIENYFRKTKFDRAIEKDNEYYRVLGLGNLFQSNDLAYHHHTVGGYSAIKPQTVQDIIDNNLFRKYDPENYVNWNVASMLNAKYIISPATLDAENLTLLDTDERTNRLLYLNNNSLPRAYFVETVKQMPNEKEVLRFLNTGDFDPDSVVATSENIENQEYDKNGTVEIIEYTPNKIILNAECEDSSFMILAETYYPIGWNALVDDNPTHIYQINHVLRGIELPPGKHKIRFEFAPKSYYLAINISKISTYAVWILLLLMLALKYRVSFKSKGM